MKKHTKLYMEHFSYGKEDFIPCELTGHRAVDIHHIVSRGSGGTDRAEDIMNLMAITRDLHLEYGDKKHYMDFLAYAHFSFMENQTPYIQINPHHECFDILLKLNNYKELLKWNRLRN